MKKNNGALLLLYCFQCLLFAACGSHKTNEPADKEKKSADTIVSIPKSNYVLDTAAVLSNQNLPSLLEELNKDHIVTHISKKEIPAFIISFIEGLKKDSFSIANPGEEWQAGDAIVEPLPARQLVYFGIGEHTALLTHLTGGIAVMQHVLIFKFDKNVVTDFWCGNLPYNLKDKESVISYLEKNKLNAGVLNTNYIFF